MSEVRKTNQKMIEKREQEQKVKKRRGHIFKRKWRIKNLIGKRVLRITVGMKVGQTFVHNPSGQTVTTAGALGGVETISSTVSIFTRNSQYGLRVMLFEKT